MLTRNSECIKPDFRTRDDLEQGVKNTYLKPEHLPFLGESDVSGTVRTLDGAGDFEHTFPRVKHRGHVIVCMLAFHFALLPTLVECLEHL